ncbi:MAG: hypothetical protein Q8M96_06015 [Rubrivivax sp.]|nr:hypothetical protein [Rubrivivax sp.]
MKTGLIGGFLRAPGPMLDVFGSGFTMHLIGIPLRKPSHNELAASTVMAVGIWLAGIGLMQAVHLALSREDAGALLLVCLWGCLSTRMGIRIEQGGRHLAINLAVNALLLGAYEVLSRLFA